MQCLSKENRGYAKSHFEDGILTGRSPEPDQIYNGDEIGVDPYLRHGSSFSLEGSTSHRRHTGHRCSFSIVRMAVCPYHR